MIVYQIDIKRIYLNRKLSDNKVIFMRQLPGFKNLKLFYYICHL